MFISMDQDTLDVIVRLVQDQADRQQRRSAPLYAQEWAKAAKAGFMASVDRPEKAEAFLALLGQMRNI